LRYEQNEQTHGKDITELLPSGRWRRGLGVAIVPSDLFLEVHGSLDECDTAGLSEEAMLYGIDPELLDPVC
jgi:hypothetical protein